MAESLHDFIQHQGFESVVEQLLLHAETQAKLHQSLGDRAQWEFWVRSWANLQKAADAIALGGNEQECLEMWQECHEGFISPLDVDFSDN